MLSAKRAPKSGSVFYRGISLRQYVKRASEHCPLLEYKDDETIFIDREQNPVCFDSLFIQTEGKPVRTEEKPITKFQALFQQGASMGLPTLSPYMAGKQLGKSLAIDRKSTDASLKGELEPVSLQFPSIERRSIIRERNITMTSRNSSRSVSCRRKLVRVIEEADERKEREASPEKRITKGVSVDEGKMGDDSRKGQNIRVYSMIKTNMVAHVRMYTRKNL